jgi:hypothetical protein
MNTLSILDLTEIASVIAIIKFLPLKLEKLLAFSVAMVQNMALQLEVIRTVMLNQITNKHINAKKNYQQNCVKLGKYSMNLFVQNPFKLHLLK